MYATQGATNWTMYRLIVSAYFRSCTSYVKFSVFVGCKTEAKGPLYVTVSLSHRVSPGKLLFIP